MASGEAGAEGWSPSRAARQALLLLILINLFNYIDRYVLAALEQPIQSALLPNDPNAQQKMGWLASAFMISYMVVSPVFGWLGDRYSRWLLIAVGVSLWSLASGATGLAWTYPVLLVTRIFVGVGEGAYGPVAPTVLSDLYPISRRGRVLAWFYMAMPVGGALGYALGGLAEHLGAWRVGFYAVVLPGLALGVWALLSRDVPRGASDGSSPARAARFADYRVLLATPSYILNTLAMASMFFAIGGMSFWMPRYLVQIGRAGSLAQADLVFGVIVALSGLGGTLLGGLAGDWLRPRWSGAYAIVSGAGLLIAFPMLLLALYAPFPLAWAFVFGAVFWTFFNTGPSNTIIANVTHPAMRSSAFAVNIFVTHLLGDAISPPIMGAIADASSLRMSFLVVSALMLLGGLLWLWAARYVGRDTELAATRLSLNSLSGQG
jgi:predicted MFS family arabinose efflux permease